MARPRIFDADRKSINVYLHKDQYEALQKLAKQLGVSPSAVIRRMLDEQQQPKSS